MTMIYKLHCGYNNDDITEYYTSREAARLDGMKYAMNVGPKINSSFTFNDCVRIFEEGTIGVKRYRDVYLIVACIKPIMVREKAKLMEES